MARELAVGSAATLIFFVSALIVPMVGLFMAVFTPLPTLLSFYRWGSPTGYWIPGIAVVLGSLLLTYLGMPEVIPYLLGMLAVGIFEATAMRRQWSMDSTIGASGLLLFGVGAVMFWLARGGGGEGLVSSLEGGLAAAITATIKEYGALTPETRMLEQALQRAVPLMVRILPGTALASALVVSSLNLLVTWRYCRIHRVPLPAWKEWPLWKAPEPLVWAVVASGVLLLLPSAVAKVLGLNGLIVLGTVYLFQGMAVVAFFFDRWKLPRVLRAVIYALLLLQQFATLGVALMGLFDVWLDFRKLTRKPVSSP